MSKAFICFGMAVVGMWALVEFLVSIGVLAFNTWGSLAIILYGLLSMGAFVKVVFEEA